MKKFSLSQLIPLLAIVAAFTLSSCNRGYGCPTNFSLNEYAIDMVRGVVHLLF